MSKARVDGRCLLSRDVDVQQHFARSLLTRPVSVLPVALAPSMITAAFAAKRARTPASTVPKNIARKAIDPV